MMDALILHANPAFGDPAQGQRVDAVLGRQHAGRQAIRRIRGFDRHGRLEDNRAGIHLRADEMHGTAMEPDAGRQRPGVGVQSPERRQQRRMDIDHAVAPGGDEFVAEDTHEARQADKLNPGGAQLGVDFRVERRPIRKRTMGDDIGGDARRAGPRQSAGIGLVGNDQGDLGRAVSLRAILDQRLHVGAAPGNENGGAQPGAWPVHQIVRLNPNRS